MATKDYLSTLQGLLGLRVGQSASQDSSSCTQGAELPSSEAMQGMDLTGLPETVLLSVLDRLSPREVAGNCCLVSHSLRDSALSNDLWRSRFNDLPEVRESLGLLVLFVASWWNKVDREFTLLTCRSSQNSWRAADCTLGCGTTSMRRIC
jgi:hypothetical protein